MSRPLRTAALFTSVVLLLGLGGVVGFFLFKNAQVVIIRFPGFAPRLDDPFPMLEFEGPLALIMAVAFICGVVVAMLLLVLPGWLRRGVERRREGRFIRGLEGELDDLRNLPISSPAPLEDVLEEGPRARAASEEDAAEAEENLLLAAALGGAGEGSADFAAGTEKRPPR
jgi:hypothetical protein